MYLFMLHMSSCRSGISPRHGSSLEDRARQHNPCPRRAQSRDEETGSKQRQLLVSGSSGAVEETELLGRAVREALLEKVTSSPRLDKQESTEQILGTRGVWPAKSRCRTSLYTMLREFAVSICKDQTPKVLHLTTLLSPDTKSSRDNLQGNSSLIQSFSHKIYSVHQNIFKYFSRM